MLLTHVAVLQILNVNFHLFSEHFGLVLSTGFAECEAIHQRSGNRTRFLLRRLFDFFFLLFDVIDSAASDPGTALAQATGGSSRCKSLRIVIVIKVGEVSRLLFDEWLYACLNLLVFGVRTRVDCVVSEYSLAVRVAFYSPLCVILDRKIVDLNLELSRAQVLVDSPFGGSFDPTAGCLSVEEVERVDRQHVR